MRFPAVVLLTVFIAWVTLVSTFAQQANLQLVGEWPGINRERAIYSVAAADNHVFFLSDNRFRLGQSFALHAMDVSDPGNPLIISMIEINSAQDLAVSGNFAFVIGEGGLQVIDISDPTRLRLVGGFGGVTGNALAVTGQRVFVAGGLDGLVILDVGDPENPRHVGSLEVGGFVEGVAVSGNYAFLLRTDANNPENSGLLIADVRDPSSPVQVAFLELKLTDC